LLRHHPVAVFSYLADEADDGDMPMQLTIGRTKASRVVETPVIAPGALLGRIGQLEVRLARNATEILAAQRIRHQIFRSDAGRDCAADGGVDIDRFDASCDHLLVTDTQLPGPAHRRIVGTYRLLRQEIATANGGFYSASEFEIDALAARHPALKFLELGRSCVMPDYRSRRTVELLWQGIWAYARRHKVDVMTGCASFPGIAPAAHAQSLSFLAQQAAAAGEWDVRAVAGRRMAMDLVPAEAVDAKRAIAAMPPLIKGYLRLGARFSQECVIDREFGTTDVFVVLPVASISERYVNYYGADATRFAA
jgi:putative hemolysin